MRKEAKSWALVFHTYNPQEIEIRKIMVQSQPWQKVSETPPPPSQPIIWPWWVPIIPAMQEM
jgi:hypothetical protein